MVSSEIRREVFSGSDSEESAHFHKLIAVKMSE